MAPKKRPAKKSTEERPAKRPARAVKLNDDPVWSTTNAKSHMVTDDLHRKYSNPKTYENWTKEDWEEMRREGLPDNAPFSEDGYSVPMEYFRYDPDWRRLVREFQEDLGAGKYDPKWIAEATQAMEQRTRGEFDEWKEDQYEEFWGQKQKKNWCDLAGESTNIKLSDLAEHGIIREGDIISYSRAIGRTNDANRILIEKDVRVANIDAATLIVAVPPGQLKYARLVPTPNSKPIKPAVVPYDPKIGQNLDQKDKSKVSDTDDRAQMLLADKGLPGNSAKLPSLNELESSMVKGKDAVKGQKTSKFSLTTRAEERKEKEVHIKSISDHITPDTIKLPLPLPQPTQGQAEDVVYVQIRTLKELDDHIVDIDGRKRSQDHRPSNSWKTMRGKRNNQDLGSLFEMREEYYVWQHPKIVKQPKPARGSKTQAPKAANQSAISRNRKKADDSELEDDYLSESTPEKSGGDDDDWEPVKSRVAKKPRISNRRQEAGGLESAEEGTSKESAIEDGTKLPKPRSARKPKPTIKKREVELFVDRDPPASIIQKPVSAGNEAAGDLNTMEKEARNRRADAVKELQSIDTSTVNEDSTSAPNQVKGTLEVPNTARKRQSVEKTKDFDAPPRFRDEASAEGTKEESKAKDELKPEASTTSRKRKTPKKPEDVDSLPMGPIAQKDSQMDAEADQVQPLTPMTATNSKTPSNAVNPDAASPVAEDVEQNILTNPGVTDERKPPRSGSQTPRMVADVDEYSPADDVAQKNVPKDSEAEKAQSFAKQKTARRSKTPKKLADERPSSPTGMAIDGNATKNPGAGNQQNLEKTKADWKPRKSCRGGKSHTLASSDEICQEHTSKVPESVDETKSANNKRAERAKMSRKVPETELSMSANGTTTEALGEAGDIEDDSRKTETSKAASKRNNPEKAEGLVVFEPMGERRTNGDQEDSQLGERTLNTGAQGEIAPSQLPSDEQTLKETASVMDVVVEAALRAGPQNDCTLADVNRKNQANRELISKEDAQQEHAVGDGPQKESSVNPDILGDAAVREGTLLEDVPPTTKSNTRKKRKFSKDAPIQEAPYVSRTGRRTKKPVDYKE